MATRELDKSLGQPDEFQSFWAKTAKWFKQYEKYVYAVVIAAAVVWAGVWGWGQYRHSQEAAAWTAYEAMVGRIDKLDKSNQDAFKQKAAAGLKQIISDYPDSAAAAQAHLELGAILAEQGSYELALTHYLAFLNQLPEDDPMRRMVVQAAGQCYEGKKDLAAAAEWYRKLAADPELADLGLWNLARVQALSGDKEQAKKTYRKLLADHPDSIYTSQVHDRLVALND